MNLRLYSLLSLVFLAVCLSHCEVPERLEGFDNRLPEADFRIANGKPEAGRPLNFLDESVDDDGQIVDWYWNFGDNAVSGEQNPVHTYQEAGTYTVVLVVSDNDGGQVEVSSAITITEFTEGPDSVVQPLIIADSLVLAQQEMKFETNLSGLFGYSFSWHFGDGTSSNENAPFHRYAKIGKYTVTLSVYDGAKSTTVTKTVKVGGEMWNFSTGGEIATSTPAVLSDGTIIIGSRDGNLYAVNSDGSLKWIFTTKGRIETSPVVSNDKIYVGSNDGSLYAVTASNGTLLWEFPTSGKIRNPVIAVSPDGNCYFGNEAGEIFAVDEAGDMRWVKMVDNPVLSTILDSKKGHLYFSLDGEKSLLQLSSKNGDLNWAVEHRAFIGGSMALDDDGNLFFAGEADGAGFIHALQPSGNTLWIKRVSKSLSRGGIAIDPAGTVYVAGKDNNLLYALRKNDGFTFWTFPSEASLLAAPTLDNNNNIIIGDAGGNFYYITNEGELLLKHTLAGGRRIWGSATIGINGRVYFGAYDKKLHALEIYVESLSTDAQWVKLGAGLNNTNHK